MLQVEVSGKGKMAKCAGNRNCWGQSGLGMQAGHEQARVYQAESIHKCEVFPVGSGSNYFNDRPLLLVFNKVLPVKKDCVLLDTVQKAC